MKSVLPCLLTLLMSAGALRSEPFAPESRASPRPPEQDPAPAPDPLPEEPKDPDLPLPGGEDAPGPDAGADELEPPEAFTRLNENRGPSFAPIQLTGEPDTPQAGDYPTCWAAATADGAREWIELGYERKIRPSAVWVYENCAPGAVYQVTGLVDGREIQLWRGVDPVPRTEPKGVARLPITSDEKLSRIRVYLDCKGVRGWNEIDAVALLDEHEELQWAVDARATTSYARSEVIPFEDPFQPPREAFEEKFAAVEARLKQNAEALAHLRGQLDERQAESRRLQRELKALRREYGKLQDAEAAEAEAAEDKPADG